MNFQKNNFSFRLYTQVLFGVNASNRVGSEARKLEKKGERTLIVTDKQLLELSLVDGITESLKNAGFDVEIFSGVEMEPSLKGLDPLVELLGKEKYDLIIGLGGGSCMDVAKIGSLLATNPGNPRDYLGNNLVKRRGLPKILIPTTAGTGSEVSRGGVVSVGDRKFAISDTRYGFADLAIVDPMNSVSMPPNVTARSGFDALSHAIESFICTESNPISDAIALKAIELVANSLRTAYIDGKNLAARCDMSMAALMAGIAFEFSCLTSTHVFAERIGPLFKIPHGVALSITLPVFLEYFAKSTLCSEKLAMIAKAMGEEVTSVTSSVSAMKAVEAVKKLSHDLDLPTNLNQIENTQEEMLRFKKITANDVGNMPNPRKITKESLLKICNTLLEA